jgi:uncharacterized repeat protein (TIGR03803 family)
MSSIARSMTKPAKIVCAIVLGAGAPALTTPSPAEAAPTTTTIHSFSGADGRLPSTGLVRGTGGVIYGTTRVGGSADKGAVFSLTPPAPGTQRWKYTLLHSFQGLADGSEPMGDPVIGHDGALYGTAWTGGSSNCGGGCGVVYRLAPPPTGGTRWRITILHFFQGAPGDGATPIGGPVFGPGGALYGTTLAGGRFSHGSVYRLTPPNPPATQWNFEIIAHFKGGFDGNEPWGSVTIHPDGRVFGTTTRGGGACDCGTVFMLTPPTPTAAGALLAAKWTKTYLRKFRGQPDGSNPYSKLVLDDAGSLYGTTFLGGSLNYGTVFKLTPLSGGKWGQNILTNFSGQGSGPLFTGALAVGPSGALFGTTANSSGDGFGGTVFKLAPPPTDNAAWKHIVLHTFANDGNDADGYLPNAAVIMDKRGRLFGTTVQGGKSFAGAVFMITQ